MLEDIFWNNIERFNKSVVQLIIVGYWSVVQLANCIL